MPRIAVLSTAHIHTRGFLKNLAAGADGRAIAAIWDDVADRGQRYATEFGTRYEGDLARLLADPAVDGFIICAENTRHLPLLARALPVGKPVFCEKPLTTRVDEARAVRRLLAAHPTPLLCGYYLPFHGPMTAVQRLLDDHAFGAITRVRCRNAHHAAYGRWFDSPDLAWFHDPALSGGGAFMDMGTHAIHLLRSLFGPVDQVWAEIANHSGAYPTCDDYGVAHLRFANGVLGTVEAGWTQTGGPGGLEIVGSAGALWHDGTGYVRGGPGRKTAPVLPSAPRPNTVDRLVGVIRGEVTPGELARDLAAAMDAVAIMETAYASARHGTWTTVPAT
jgi:predicted dehydrogenase